MIWQMIEDWFRGILTDGILSNLSGLFDSVNTEVGEIATQVGTTPAGWNAGIFNMIRSLSENVIVPIAGVIITFVMCYELIQLVIEKNNLHDLDTWIFFKWIFKTFVAVLLVTNTWNIVMGVFDITQSVVNDSAGVIISDTSIDIATVITDIEAKLDAMSVGGLLGLWFQSLFVGLTMKALSICIMLVVYGRMIEIYLVTSIAPIPVATMVNREWGGMGQNYLKSLLALGFQAFLILVCVGIYAVLIQTIAATDKSVAFVWLKQNRKSPTWFYGLGFWTRGNAEICLLATKGHPKRQSNKVHQFIISPVEQHSKKPDITREKILALMGDLPRIELFARQHTPGWDVWGNEIKSDIRFAGKEV